MVNKSIIKYYLSCGKSLIPINGKIPKKGWRTAEYTDDEIFNHQGNIAMRLSDADLIIDIDPRNGGLESFKKLKEKLNFEFEYDVKTAGGGYHIYLTIPENYKNCSFKKVLRDFPGVDFLTEGSSCSICGCKNEQGLYEWYDDILDGFSKIEAPEQLLNLLTFNCNSKKYKDGDFFEDMNVKFKLPEDRVLDMLSKLDPSMCNDEWVKVGMALQDWDSVRGLELWEEWSQDGDNYEAGESEKRWKSFKTSHGVTLGTVDYIFKEVDYD